MKPPWRYLPTNHDALSEPGNRIDMERLTIENSAVPVLVEAIAEPTLDKVDLYYICVQCGKVYWHGVHLEDVCQRFANILNTRNTEEVRATTSQNFSQS